MTVATISLEFTEAFQRRFRDCFRRRETWERFLLYLHDQLHDSERTSPDAALTEGTGAVRSRQRFLSNSVWDAEKVMARYHEEVRDALGDRDGALVFQIVDFVKKGSDSAGERLAAFVRMSGVVEEASHCLREATTGAGLNRYAVRTWTGWHRHTLACMVAHFFRSGRLPGGADQVLG